MAESWSFLTNHARVLLCIARDPGVRLRELAASLGITERSAHAIVADLTAAGYHPFHAPCGILLDEARRPASACIRCATCDGFPCLVHAKSDAEVIAVRPLLDNPNVTLLTSAEVVRLETSPSGREVTGVVVAVIFAGLAVLVAVARPGRADAEAAAGEAAAGEAAAVIAAGLTTE